MVEQHTILGGKVPRLQTTEQQASGSAPAISPATLLSG
jgi:hypothetical protein